MHALSKPELRRVLEIARARRERDWLMILVAYWHGLRASEVIALTPDNIVDGHLIVQRLKGSNKTEQPLVTDPDPLFSEVPALIDFASFRHGNQKLFPVSRVTFWRNFHRYALAAGIAAHRCHPHVLKHSIAMHAIHSAGIENTRAYLGHKSIASTGSYLKVTDTEAAAAVVSAARVGRRV